jgi:hypothetical protein
MKERREKGICYYCDKNYNPSHKCKSPKIYLIQGMEWKPDEKQNEDCECRHELEEGEVEHELIDHLPEISLHAIFGTPTPNTMRLVGFIRT